MKSSGEMQWLSQSPHVTHKRLSWYGHVMRRDDTNVAKQVTMMKVGGKIPRGRPRLRWMDRVRSDLKQHKHDPNLAQNREAWKKAIMAIDPGRVFFSGVRIWLVMILFYFILFGTHHVHRITHESLIMTYFQCGPLMTCGGLEWEVESTTVTHSSADWWDLLLPLT